MPQASDIPVFIACTGQHDNIGDVVLRRRLLDEVRGLGLGPLHVLLAGTDAGFIEALRLGPQDKPALDRAEWLSARERAVAEGPVLYVAKPGEIQMEPRKLIQAVRDVPMLRRVSQAGGAVVQLGIGARTHPRFLTPVMGATFRYHDLVAWRDPVSRAHFGFGDVMPDWGFDDHGPSREEQAEGAPRPLLTISLRGDRPYPGPDWFRSLRAFAAETGLRPMVVTQVKRDAPMARQLACDLASDLLDWTGETHIEQERRLRHAYRHSRLVISDRLHVLILAVTEQAIPLCYLERAEGKVGRNFDAIGYRKASVDVSAHDLEVRLGILREAVTREAEMRDAHRLACGQVRAMGEKLRRVAGRIRENAGPRRMRDASPASR